MDAVSADQAYDSFEGLKDIQRVLARRLVDSGALNESILEKYDFIFRFNSLAPGTLLDFRCCCHMSILSTFVDVFTVVVYALNKGI